MSIADDAMSIAEYVVKNTRENEMKGEELPIGKEAGYGALSRQL